LIDFAHGRAVDGSLDVRWRAGQRPGERTPEPPIEAHAFDDHTWILRQSKSVNYEAPFMYLFLGNERALLVDTGATPDGERFPLRATVDRLIDAWLTGHPRDRYGLTVAHSHGHGDHVAADGQFEGRPDTVVVGRDQASVEAFFDFSAWPDGSAQYDLGGRVLEILPCPGHQGASIAIYDRWSGFLVTGDSVYPGRLYVPDPAAFAASMQRLVRFAQERPVEHVMGCHVEMARAPGQDYPLGSTYQPDERPLPMTVDQLIAVRDKAQALADQPGAHMFDDFALWIGPCQGAMLRQAARSLVRRAALRLGLGR
jgi:hydroxyacylglutathione hydrolase